MYIIGTMLLSSKGNPYTLLCRTGISRKLHRTCIRYEKYIQVKFSIFTHSFGYRVATDLEYRGTFISNLLCSDTYEYKYVEQVNIETTMKGFTDSPTVAIEGNLASLILLANISDRYTSLYYYSRVLLYSTYVNIACCQH